MSTAPERPHWPADEIAELMRDQHHVVSRRQLKGLGGTPGDLERMLRRKDLVRLLPGVFVGHTGEPTWLQRAWAGVLHFWPAALAEGSAARVHAGPGWREHDESDPITIAVDASRTVRAVPGYRVRRMVRLTERVQWNRSPPRVRFEDTVVDLATRAASRLDAVALFTNACQTRSTNASRLLAALDDRARVPDREWLRRVLTDIDDGTCSVLEQGYLDLVERPHGFPHASRNAPELDDGRRCFRDVSYDEHDLIVELDGRAFHDGARRRDADLDRDLRSIADGRATVRLGWGQVFARPCETAAALASVLRARGWPGHLTPCGVACEAEPGTSSNL